MIFRVYRPQGKLGAYIDHLWYAEADQRFSGRERILPDGAVQIIINLGPVQYLVEDCERLGFTSGWITGQRTKPIEVDVTPDYRALGIRFNNPGGYELLRFPVSELTDSTVEIDHIWGCESEKIRERLLKSSGIEEKFSIVDAYLTEMIANLDKPPPALRFTAHLLQSSTHKVSIGETAHKMGISHKHLIRLFKKHIGLTPKQYQRVHRFQHILNLVPNIEKDFSRILNDTDFYDQAHFNREFKAFCGMAPQEYILRKKADAHTLVMD